MKHKIGWWTAAGIVVANMIGTGVFTSLGFQLMAVENTLSIMTLWILGGLLSLIGAWVYAELGTHYRGSGGDYIFLSRTFHPALGYLYAWTSFVVGFSAPVSIAAMAMYAYLTPWLGNFNGSLLGIIVILIVTVFHSINLKYSGLFHNVFTVIKIVFALALIAFGILMPAGDSTAINFDNDFSAELLLPGFAVSLIYVSYAYTGWNSAAYITDDIESPGKNLPRALIFGTLFVTIVYVLLQIVFLKHASLNSLKGKVDVASEAFSGFFDGRLLPWISLFISIQLVATISGYLWIGPRITHAKAKEFKFWQPLSKLNNHGIPVRALWFNSGMSILLLLSGSFEQILLYAGFVLQLMGTLTILSSLFIKTDQSAFKTPLKPIPQIVYIVFSIWVLSFMLIERTWESVAGLGIIGAGLALYYFDKKVN